MFHVLISTYLRPPDVVAETRPAHAAWLSEEIEAGRLLLAGRQESERGGVLITGDISAEEAQAMIDRDPYQLAGVARYDRIGFNGAFRAPGL